MIIYIIKLLLFLYSFSYLARMNMERGQMNKILCSIVFQEFDLIKFLYPAECQRGEFKLVDEHLNIDIIRFNRSFFNYTIDWNKYNTKLSDFAATTSKCPLCTFTSKAMEGNSNSSDAILTIAFSKIAGYWPFIRSLRTAPSRCTVVIFINSVVNSKMTDEFMTLSKNCGVTFINIGEFDTSDRQRIFVFRFEVYFDFIVKRRKIFNRVILIDMFDTFFQGDPFTSHWDYSSFQASNEPASASPDQHRIEKLLIPDEIAKDFPQYRNVCAGVLGGTTDQLIEFMLLFFRFSNAHSKIISENHIHDQEIINCMCKSGYMQRNKVGCKWHDNNYLVFQDKGRTRLNNEIGSIRYVNESVTPIQHCYDRIFVLVRALRAVCPNQNVPNIDKYMKE